MRKSREGSRRKTYRQAALAGLVLVALAVAGEVGQFLTGDGPLGEDQAAVALALLLGLHLHALPHSLVGL